MTIIAYHRLREDWHFRVRDTLEQKKRKRGLFFPWWEHQHSVTRTMTWGQKEEEGIQGLFSSFVQSEHALFEQHHVGSVSSAVKNFQLSLKCLLNFRVFSVLRFDQQALLKASFPLLLEENCWSSSWAFHTQSKWPQGLRYPETRAFPGAGLWNITGKVAPCRPPASAAGERVGN